MNEKTYISAAKIAYDKFKNPRRHNELFIHAHKNSLIDGEFNILYKKSIYKNSKLFLELKEDNSWGFIISLFFLETNNKKEKITKKELVQFYFYKKDKKIENFLSIKMFGIFSDRRSAYKIYKTLCNLDPDNVKGFSEVEENFYVDGDRDFRKIFYSLLESVSVNYLYSENIELYSGGEYIIENKKINNKELIKEKKREKEKVKRKKNNILDIDPYVYFSHIYSDIEDTIDSYTPYDSIYIK